MTRSNLILACLACIQGLVLFLITLGSGSDESGGPDAGEKVESRSLLALEVEDVRSFMISWGKENEELDLERKDEGDSWQIVNRHGFPVRPGKIGDGKAALGLGLLDGLMAMEVARPIASSRESHAALALADDDFAHRIELLGEKDEKLATVYLARGSRSDSCYVRLGGEDEVYETLELSPSRLSYVLTDFIGTGLLDVEQEKVTALRFQKPGSDEVAVLRGGDAAESAWSFSSEEEGEVDEDALEEALGRLSGLRIFDVTGSFAGAPDDHLARFEIDHDGKTDVIYILRSLEDEEYTVGWLPRDGARKSGFEVLVPGWSLGSLLELEPSKLRKAPAEKSVEEEK